MKRQILNLEGVAVLTKEQQKMVSGGGRDYSLAPPNNSGGNGTCCARKFNEMTPGNYSSSVVCDVSKEAAISWAGSGAISGNWCCDSCGSASWTVIG